MASNYPLYKITYTFAQNGNKKIPPATASAAGTGRFSQAKGFDQINSKPLNQGGIPPYREDFNGAFYLLSSFLRWYQQGGIMKYDATLDYELDNEIYYNGSKYRCIQANGASTTVKAPTDTSYWEVINNVGDPVRYNTVQSLSASQQLQARTNIGALGSDEFNSQGGVKFKTNSDYLQLLSTNNAILSEIPWQTIPNVYSRNKPVVTDILWSGDLDHGDLVLSEDFTEYDILMFIGGCNDSSPPDGPYCYSFVPVWILKALIVDRSLFGLTLSYFDVLNNNYSYWGINLATSTKTRFVHHTNAVMHMWRVIGIRYTSSVSPV